MDSTPKPLCDWCPASRRDNYSSIRATWIHLGRKMVALRHHAFRVSPGTDRLCPCASLETCSWPAGRRTGTLARGTPTLSDVLISTPGPSGGLLAGELLRPH